MATAPLSGRRRRLRSKVRLLLLALWFGVSFGALFFARDLQWTVGGWPFNYWLAAQGGVLAFVAIVGAYAAVMRRIAPEDDPEWPTHDE